MKYDYKPRFIDRLATAFGAHNMLDVDRIEKLTMDKCSLEAELKEVCVNPESVVSSEIIAVTRYRDELDRVRQKKLIDAFRSSAVQPFITKSK